MGGAIASLKTTWRTACEKAGIVDLHFHDLRREFASATPMPHGAIGAYAVDDALDAETIEGIAVGVVSRIFTSWNRIREWLGRLEQLRRVA